MNRIVYLASVVVVVAGVQAMFSVRFDHDEWERIIVTVLGIGGVEALAAAKK